MYVITESQFRSYGCTNCSCFCGHWFITDTDHTAGLWFCHKCQKSTTIVKHEGVDFHLISVSGFRIVAFNKHPRQGMKNHTCKEGCDETVEIEDAGVFVTPGCFVSGGADAERNGLVLKARCPRAAQHIAWMFEVGAHQYDDRILVGVNKNHIGSLNRLLWHVLKHQKINIGVVQKTQLQAHH